MNFNKFKNIPTEYRNAPFWSLNDKLCKEEMERQIEDIVEKGWGSYFAHSRVGLVTGYLSPEWFELMKVCAQKARETNTLVWLYDEDKWPSGFAGGELAKNPAFRSRSLVLLEAGSEGENDETLEAVAFGGAEYVIAKRVSPLGDLWFNGMCYCDLMNPEAVKAFLECTHERYKEHCGEYFGKEIPGIFTDEPCYLVARSPVPAVPWSDKFPEFFEKKKGYSIVPHLQELFFEINDYRKTRYDFFDSAAELFLESFTKQYYNWCESNNLKMTGHLMSEDYLTYQTQWVGSVMPHYEFMHLPGVDKLGRHLEQTITMKQVSSVVEQLGKDKALCETFGGIGQQCAFRERKWISDWQAVLGISFVNSHLSLYSMRGERKRDYPSNLFYQQPWWSEERMFADYTGRLCEAAAHGKREAKILVIHPIGSAWSEYSPITKKQTVYDEPFQKLTDALIEENLDFHYGDESILKNHASISNGNIKVGEYEYEAVVVPPALTLTANTVKLLSEFGGRLIFIYPFPTRIDGNLHEKVMADNVVKVKSIQDAVTILSDLFCRRVRTTDMISGANAKKLICCVKETAEDKLVLFANTEPVREINASLEIPETRTPYLLDLASGKVFAIPHTKKSEAVIIDAKFYFGGSMAVLFSDDKITPMGNPQFTDTGVSFNENYKTLSEASEYTVTRKEENVLPINKVTLFMNGENILNDAPIAAAWHKHFYKAADGTPFAAEYHFCVKELPEGEVFAVVECAQNLSCVTVNGKEVPPLRKKGEAEVFDPAVNYLDVNFIRIPMTGAIHTGDNLLRIEGVKVNNVIGAGWHVSVKDFSGYNSTEVETVYIVGDFSVEGKIDSELCISRKSGLCHKDVTSTGAPFYPGKVLIKCNADLSAAVSKAYIRLKGVNASCAKVFIDGTETACKYLMPFIYEIPEGVKKDSVEITVEITNTLFNLMGPGWVSEILNDIFIGPNTFVNFDRYTEEPTLLPFGVEGVEIIEFF